MLDKEPEREASGQSNYLFPLLRLGFGSVFVVSGILKLFDIGAFRHTIEVLQLLPQESVATVALAIPFAELLLGGAICLNVRLALTSQIAVAFLVLFTAVLITKMVEGASFTCNCFGKLGGETVDGYTILRNVALVIWGVGLAAYSSTWSSDRRRGPTMTRKPLENALGRNTLHIAWHMMVIVAFIFLVTISIALSSQNEILKSRLATLISNAETLPPKEVAPPFIATSLSGNDTTIFHPKKGKTLLFVLKAACEACNANIPVWKSLAERVETSGVAVLAVSVDTLSITRSYIAQHKLSFMTVSIWGKKFTSQYRVIVTPHTIALEGNTIIKTWRGALDRAEEFEILNTLLGS